MDGPIYVNHQNNHAEYGMITIKDRIDVKNLIQTPSSIWSLFTHGIVQRSVGRMPSKICVFARTFIGILPNQHNIITIVGAPLVGALSLMGIHLGPRQRLCTRRAGTRPAPTRLEDVSQKPRISSWASISRPFRAIT